MTTATTQTKDLEKSEIREKIGEFFHLYYEKDVKKQVFEPFSEKIKRQFGGLVDNQATGELTLYFKDFLLNGKLKGVSAYSPLDVFSLYKGDSA